MNNKFVCCICGKKFIGWGNNPWPIDTREDARCCDDCNSERVIPARLEQMGYELRGVQEKC